VRTNPVRTEMRCKKAMRADRHAGCVNQRRVLRETSQHATRMTGILQPVSADDEADCQPGDGQRRMSATVMFQPFECDLNPAGNIFCLLRRPVSGRPFLYMDVFMPRSTGMCESGVMGGFSNAKSQTEPICFDTVSVCTVTDCVCEWPTPAAIPCLYPGG